MLEHLNKREKDSFLILEIGQDLVGARVREVRSILEEMLLGIETDLAFDFNGSDFIDSSGLALILSYAKKQDFLGKQYRLINVSDEIIKILESVRLLDKLDIRKDENDL